MRALILTKKGDRYDEASVDRDYVTLWNTQRFNDLSWGVEPGQTGWIVTFNLVERPGDSDVRFMNGLKSIFRNPKFSTCSMERKVGLSADSQVFDPNKVQHASWVVLEEFLGRARDANSRDGGAAASPGNCLPPEFLVIFKVDEGPKVKVNEINFMGNVKFSHKQLLRPMVNLHPYGLPHSVFFESVFPKAWPIPPSWMRTKTGWSSSIATTDITPLTLRIRPST